MEAALSQSPSSNTRSKSRVLFVGDKGRDNVSVVAKKLEESRLKARERQRRKRERDRSEMESSQKKKKLKVSFEEGEESTQHPAEGLKTNDKDTTLSTADEKRRLKARERQRRKRERDRSRRGISLSNSNSTTIVNVPVTNVGCVLPPPDKEIMQITSHPPDIISIANPDGSIANPSTSNVLTSQEPLSSIMTPYELAKREKIRQAARDRQRKHRALVKAKRIAAETGIPMTTTVESPEQSAANQQDEHHEPIIEDSIAHPPHIHVTPQGPSFPIPQSHITLGQTFAQIMLLSVSYTPTLKRDLLRTLHMSEEDLNSLMPMIGSVWDQWSYDRSLHHTANASESASGDDNAASTSYIPPSPNTNTTPLNPDQYSTTPDQDQTEDADQFQEPYDLSSTDFSETPLVSIIYHLKNRLSQLFKRENRRLSFNRSH